MTGRRVSANVVAREAVEGDLRAPARARVSGPSARVTTAWYGSRPVVRPASRSSVAAAASRALTNASYMPSPESGSTSPAASPTTAAVPRARTRARAAASAAGSRARRSASLGVDAVLARRAAAGARAAAGPRSPSRRRRRSRGRPSGRPSRSRRGRRRARAPCGRRSAQRDAVVAEVPLERDAVDDLAARARARARSSPLHAVGADDDARVDRSPSTSTRVSLSTSATRDAVAELGACLGRLLDEELVEPPPLRHQGERRARPRSNERP